MTPTTRPTAFARALLVVSGLLAVAVPAEALQSKDQQACIRATTKAFARVAAAEAKSAAACVKAAAGGAPAHASVAACIAADPKGKIAAAVAKATEGAVKACGEAPDFGVADLTGAAAVAAASGARLEVLEAVFGAPIDDALVEKATDKDGASCQAAVVKAADRCWKARVASFAACSADGVDADIDDVAGLAACRDGDADGDIARACVADVQKTLDSKCEGADLAALLPACACRYTQDCVALAVGNEANARLSDSAAMPAASVLLPDVRTAQTPLPDPWISPEWGEFRAVHVLGREVDAPLACPLGAVNVYTIMDAMADAAYNAAVAPLLANQGVRVMISPKTPVDLTGTSPADLVLGTQAMPLYSSAKDFLRLASRLQAQALIPLKHAQVEDTLRFGLQACLHDCAAIYAEPGLPNVVFGSRLLAVHFDADRATVEGAVDALAAEAEAAPGVELRWVGRTVGDFKLELIDGSVVQGFNALPADGTLVYELDPVVDPVLEVLTLPALSAFLSLASDEAVVLLE